MAPISIPRKPLKLIDRVSAINWNRLEDEKDLEVWDRLTGNFRLPEKVPVSNDIPSWQKMTEDEHTLTMHVFTGLTLRDTIQGTVGAVSRIRMRSPRTRRPCTPTSPSWNPCTPKATRPSSPPCAPPNRSTRPSTGARTTSSCRKGGNRARLLRGRQPVQAQGGLHPAQSFLFYSGFYLPMYFSAHAKLTNTADVIRLIIRDEAVHGYDIGHKYQKGIAQLSDAERLDLQDYTYSNCSTSCTTTKWSTPSRCTTAWA